jgi:hypothetical protein
MPSVTTYTAAPAGKLIPFTIRHIIEANIVFEGISSGHVVVVLVTVTENKTTSLVYLTRHWLAANGKSKVSERRFIGHCDRESIVCPIGVELSKYMRTTGCTLFLLHNPSTQLSIASPAKGKPGRSFTRHFFVEIPNPHRCPLKHDVLQKKNSK